MKRLLILLGIAAASIAVGARLWDSEQRVNARLSELENIVVGQRKTLDSLSNTDPEDTPKLMLMLRALESEWVGSHYSPLQARLTCEADVVPPRHPIRLLAEVRNSSNQQQTVSEMRLHAGSIKLYLGSNLLKYLGPWKSMQPPRPVTLAPGRIMRAWLVVDSGHYAELNSPGQFSVEWAYGSIADAGTVTWFGSLPPLHVSWKQE